MLNALGQVHIGNRKALKFLNVKLESLDGALQETDEDDIVRILNGRATHDDYDSAPRADKLADDNKGEYEFNVKLKRRHDEDLWYILNEKLEGIDPRGKLKGLREGEGLAAYQKTYKWYSAVTGGALATQMTLAMRPEPPKKVTEVATQLEL